jgi:hypothetical protein
MRRVVASVFLLLEGLAGAVWVAGLLPVIAGYDLVVILLVVARLLVGMCLCTSGWLLSAARPPGEALARLALLASAILTTLETGFRLVPTNADPTYRWVTVGLYWAYAAGMAWLVSRLAPPAESTI